MKVTARVSLTEPLRACETLANPERLKGRIAVIERGDCIFVNKVRRAEEAGAIAVIVVDNTPGSSAMTSSIFAMSGDGNNDVSIPAIFLFYEDASHLLKAIVENPSLEVTIADNDTVEPNKSAEDILAAETLLGRLKGSFEDLLGKIDLSSEDQRAPLKPLAGKDNLQVTPRDRPEGPNPANDLSAHFQDAVPSQEDAPPWLMKLYEKLRGDTEPNKPQDAQQVEIQTHAIAIYVMKVFLSHEKSEYGGVVAEYSDAERAFVEMVQSMHTIRADRKPGWQENYSKSCGQLRTLLNKVEKLVSAMTNDSEFVNSPGGSKFIKKKSDFILLLRLLVDRFESLAKTMTEVYQFETQKEDDIVVVRPSEDVDAEKYPAGEEPQTKDEL